MTPEQLQAQERSDELIWTAALAKMLPPIKTVGEQWFKYEDGVWQQASKHLLRPLAQRVIPAKKLKAAKEKAVLDLLEGHSQVDGTIFRGALGFDSERRILMNTASGVLQVEAGKVEVLPFGKDYHFTRRLNAIYNPKAECPLFQEVLSWSLPDAKDRELYQLCLGNFLLPDCRFETALVCYGESGTGKSTLAEPVTHIFGEAPKGLMTRLGIGAICDPKSYSLPKLRYACVNLGSELESIEVAESSNFKTIVSGEPVEARDIYTAPFTMHSHCKLWFLANHLPRFKNGTDAELRRTRFLRFEKKPEKPDGTLKYKLSLEKDGVFAWMVEGLRKLLVTDVMPFGGEFSRGVHERFKVSNDPLGTFVKGYCRLGGMERTVKTDLEASFMGYCQQNNISEKFSSQFFKNLYERYPGVKEQKLRVEEGRRERVIAGLGLTEGALKELAESRAVEVAASTPRAVSSSPAPSSGAGTSSSNGGSSLVAVVDASAEVGKGGSPGAAGAVQGGPAVVQQTTFGQNLSEVLDLREVKL